MTRRICVVFENGVFVPREKVDFAEHQPLTLLLDDRFPDDPPPEGGPELVDWIARHRIKIDPRVAREIIESDEYLDQESDDEP